MERKFSEFSEFKASEAWIRVSLKILSLTCVLLVLYFVTEFSEFIENI